MSDLAGARNALESAGLVIAHWVCCFLAGYVAVEWPVTAAIVMIAGAAAVAYGMLAAVCSGRRTPVGGRFAVVALLLAVSAMLGFAGGAGMASQGTADPWMGLACAGLAWLVAVARRPLATR